MSAAEMDVAEDTKTEVEAPYRLDILEYITIAQRENGLRHKDYMRYRQYCTRKLRRVRRVSKFSNHKVFKKQILGADMKYVVNSSFLELPLLNAERAWSFANELKSDLNQEAPRKRFRLLKRLDKAAKWSAELLRLCSAKADARTQLEAEAYSSYMHANMHLERERYAEAVHKFTLAKSVYEQLGNISDPGTKLLCEGRVSEIEPNLRYCRYVLSRSGGSVAPLSDEKMSADLMSKILSASSQLERKTQVSNLLNISWKGETVPVPSHEKLKLALLKSQDLSKRLATATAESTDMQTDAAEAQALSDKASEHSEVLAAFEDAIGIVRNLSKDSTFKSDEDRMYCLSNIRDYCTYNKASIAVKRILLLVRSLQIKLALGQSRTTGSTTKKLKPDELAVLYEKALQNVSTMQGVLGDESAAVVEDMRDQLDDQTLVFRAFKCYYLALSFSQQRKTKRAYLLLERVMELVAECKREDVGAQYTADLTQLLKDARLQSCQVRATQLLKNYQAQENITENMSNVGLSPKKRKRGDASSDHTPNLLQRLKTFDSGSDQNNIIDFPPTFIPTPCKPILFDLAFNQIDFETTSLEERTKVKKGWLGGWWG